jgi:hypothetical protein
MATARIVTTTGLFLAVTSMALLMYTGCDKSCDITITGTVVRYELIDSMEVIIKEGIKRTIAPPTQFIINSQGQFKLHLVVDGKPPRVIFRKNGRVYATLRLKRIWKYDPVIVEGVSGKRFPLDISKEGRLRANITL